MVLSMEVRDLLDDIYLSTKGGGGAFSGPAELYRRAVTKKPDIKKSVIAEYLRSVKGYTLHSRILRRFKTRKYLALYPGETWVGDIIYLRKLRLISSQKTHNTANYALIIIDLFSLKVYGEIMSRKTAESTLVAFKKILARTKSRPLKLQTDRGKEFGGPFALYCKAHSIDLYHSATKLKASRVEVANYAIKLLLHRIMTHFNSSDVGKYLSLAISIHNANSSRGLPLSLAPNAAEQPMYIPRVQKYYLERRAEFARKIKKSRPHPRFRIGDTVRKVNSEILGGQRGYEIRFSQKLYTIESIAKTMPRMYFIGVFKGGQPRGFYQEELRLATERATDNPKILDITSSKLQALSVLRNGKETSFERLYLCVIEGMEKPRYLSRSRIEQYKNGASKLQFYWESHHGSSRPK